MKETANDAWQQTGSDRFAWTSQDGYATEAAQACLDFAFQQAGLSEVYSFTSLLNQLSQKVMQKLSMEFVKEFDNEKAPADSPVYRHVLYRIKSFH